MLRQIVRDWAGTSAELAEFAPLDGGSISTTLRLKLVDGNRAVLKITPHRVDRSYADEACQLKLLNEVGLPVPEVYAFQIGSLDAPFSYVLMEFVEGIDLAAAKARCAAEAFNGVQTHLAELMLQLHARTGPHFMRVSAGDAKPFDDWPAFYRDAFDPIWRDVERSNVLPVKCRKAVAKAHDRLGRLLAHDDPPRLLHWDVWSANVLVHPDATGRWRVRALLDPNCKYGHAEAELAYMELFHTATPAFFKAYQLGRRLPPEYQRVRKPLYQLYSLLNHMHLFGPAHLKQVVAAIDRVRALV